MTRTIRLIGALESRSSKIVTYPRMGTTRAEDE
jgi:hypothetical protein